MSALVGPGLASAQRGGEIFVDASLSAKAQAQALKAAASRLGVVRERASPQSVAVFQEFLAGRTPEEVAAHFEMTLQAVYQVRQRMRKRLQEQIARQLHDEEFPERRSEGATS